MSAPRWHVVAGAFVGGEPVCGLVVYCDDTETIEGWPPAWAKPGTPVYVQAAEPTTTPPDRAEPTPEEMAEGRKEVLREVVGGRAMYMQGVIDERARQAAGERGRWEALLDDGGSSLLCHYVEAASAGKAVAAVAKDWPRHAIMRLLRLRE